MGCEKYDMCAYPLIIGIALNREESFFCTDCNVDHSRCNYYENPPTTAKELFERIEEPHGIEKKVKT